VIELVRHFLKRHKAGKTVEGTIVDVARDAADPGVEHEPTH